MIGELSVKQYSVRVLLVEDNPDDAMLIQESIADDENADFDITVSPRLTEALRIAHQQPFDAIILDLSLPDSFGLDTFKRAKKEFPDLPILVMTGAKDAVLESQLFEAGAQDFLHKSNSLGGLARLIDVAIQRNQPVVEERRLLQRLLESEERFSRLIADSDEAILMLDNDGNISLANPAAVQLLDRPAEELVGSPFDIPIIKSGDAELEIITGRGELRTITMYSVDFFWKGEPTQMLRLREITAQVRAEAQLHLRDRALAAASEGIVITDATKPGNPIIYSNNGFLRLTGYTHGEVSGKGCDFLFGPDADAAEIKRLKAAEKTLEPTKAEILCCRRDGTRFWNRISLTPLFADRRRLSHFVWVHVDETDSRRLNEQLAQARRMESIGKLAGGIAHDFNNILTGILGFSDLVLDSPHADEIRDDLLEVRSLAHRAQKLTRQLLAFSRKQNIHLRPLDLNHLILEMKPILKVVFPENIHVDWKLTDETTTVQADAGQIEQVLLNLAVNARDAMPQGGELTIETSRLSCEDFESDETAELPMRDCVLVSFIDSGIGMDAETVQRAFEPFFTTKGTGQGTGLGLSTAYGIVRQHGGCILVDSELGRGTTFDVYLPATTDPIEVHDELTPVRQLPLNNTGIVLLVEDEPSVREITKRMLERCGYTVLEAGDASEAMDVFNQAKLEIDLLLTDVVMPGESGPVLYERLRKLRPELRVLFMSGYIGSALSQHGLQTEEYHLIEKPFDSDKLLASVQQIMES